MTVVTVEFSRFCAERRLESLEYAFTIICCILTGIPFIHGCIWFSKNFKKVHKAFSVSFFVIGIGYQLWCLTSGFAVLSCFYITDTMQRLSRIFGFQVYIVQVYLSSFIILWRLRMTFAPTKYSLNPYLYKKYVIIIICGFFVTALGSILALWYSQKNESIYKIGALGGAVGYLTYLISFVLILRQFVKTLLKVVIDRQKQKIHENGDLTSYVSATSMTDLSSHVRQPTTDQLPSPNEINTNGSRISLKITSSKSKSKSITKLTSSKSKIDIDHESTHDTANKRMIKTATKYFALALVIFMTTFFGVCTTAVQVVKKTYTVIHIVNMALFIDGFTNFICLYLQYQFSTKAYSKLCRCCHRCIKRKLYSRVHTMLITELSTSKQIDLNNAKKVTSVSVDVGNSNENDDEYDAIDNNVPKTPNNDDNDDNDVELSPQPINNNDQP